MFQLWHGMYLYGRRFKVITDNEAIKWLFSPQRSEGRSAMRLQKWIISMMDLDFDVVHRKGASHGNADGLSRNCLQSTCPYGLPVSEPLHGVAPPIQCMVSASPPLHCEVCKVECCSAPTVAEFRDHFGSGHCPITVQSWPDDSDTSLASRVCPTVQAGPSYFPTGDGAAWDLPAWVTAQRADLYCSRLMSRIDACEAIPGMVLGAGGALTVSTPTRETSSPASGRSSHRRRHDQRLVVPDSLKAFVLWRHHGLPLAGHHGRKRTYEEISRRFWWKGMWKTTRRWVRACDVCSRRKMSRPKRQGVPRFILCSYPFEMVSIDLLGPLPVTLSGNKYLLTILDCFSRWPIVVPLPDTSAPTVALALFQRLLTMHGRPTRILSDRGRQLISEAVKQLCATWDIKKIETTGYQPQSVPVERFHRYLNSALTALHGRFGVNWDAYVDAVAFTYRVSVNESTGCSPFTTQVAYRGIDLKSSTAF